MKILLKWLQWANVLKYFNSRQKGSFNDDHIIPFCEMKESLNMNQLFFINSGKN